MAETNCQRLPRLHLPVYSISVRFLSLFYVVHCRESSAYVVTELRTATADQDLMMSVAVLAHQAS